MDWDTYYSVTEMNHGKLSWESLLQFCLYNYSAPECVCSLIEFNFSYILYKYLTVAFPLEPSISKEVSKACCSEEVVITITITIHHCYSNSIHMGRCAFFLTF